MAKNTSIKVDEFVLSVLLINIVGLIGPPLLLYVLAGLATSHGVQIFLVIVGFLWVLGMIYPAFKTVEQNEVGVYLFGGKYLGSTGAGPKFVIPLMRLEKPGVENLQIVFSPFAGERKGVFAKTITLADITTAGEGDAYWEELYWKRPFSEMNKDNNVVQTTWEKKIKAAEYNKRVTLNPSVAFILKPRNLRLIYQNLGGSSFAEKKKELERQLFRVANTVLNREFKKRTYGQLTHMMTITDPLTDKGTLDVAKMNTVEEREAAKLNLDRILQKDTVALINGSTRDNPGGDPNANLGYECILANIPKLNATAEVHKSTNAIQEKKLTNIAEVMGSEKDKVVRQNQGEAEANYLIKVHKAVEESGVKVTDYLKIRANVDMANGANKTLITNTSGVGDAGPNTTGINTALQLELLEQLKRSRQPQEKNKPSKKTSV